MPRYLCFLLAACALQLSLVACPRLPASPEIPGPEGNGKTFYLDAALGFTVEYPVHWDKTSFRDGAKRGVHWSAPPSPSERGGEASITSVPLMGNLTSPKNLAERFREKYPAFTISTSEFLPPEEPPSSLEVVGYTPSKVYLLRFIVTKNRAFTIEFSSPPEYFDLYTPLFRGMAETFSPLP